MTDDPIGRDLRYAMSHWPTGVAILATRPRERVQAITINSFTSVSLDPPLVLVSIAEKAGIIGELNEAGRFTISMLANDQSRIASMAVDRMPGLQEYFEGEIQPVIKDAIACLFCEIAQTHQAGDHVLYLGVVREARVGRDAPPLLYLSGKYHK